MKKIFIAYADDNMSYSLRRIGRQAMKLKIFDEIILYTPKQLPTYMKDSILMTYSYGGGYWAWKPCIIYETLLRNPEGTVVCYVDAGCTLQNSVEWTLYFEIMKTTNTLCFKYRDFMPEWSKYGAESAKIMYWTKKSTLLFLDQYIGDDKYREINKVWGGALFFRGKDNALLQDWMNLTMNHPEIILDPDAEELQDQYPFFALHKHDQSILTALSYKHKRLCVILPELSETVNGKGAITASRIRAKNWMGFCVGVIKGVLRKVFGNRFVELIKNRCFKYGK